MRLVPIYRKDGSIVAHAKVDDADYDAVNRHRWFRHSRGYATRQASTVLMHREIMGAVSRHTLVDHWNHDKLDNRRENLRVATVAENGQNRRGANRNNATSGVRGVRRIGNRWYARAWNGRRELSLGSFDTPDSASAAIAAWRAEHMPFSHEAATTTGGQ